LEKLDEEWSGEIKGKDFIVLHRMLRDFQQAVHRHLGINRMKLSINTSGAGRVAAICTIIIILTVRKKLAI